MTLKNLSQKLKILILFILISLFFINSKSFSSSNKNDYCGDDSKKFAGFKKELIYPKLIELEIKNTNKWYKRILRSIAAKKGNIPKKNKRYQNTKLLVHFNNDMICRFEGRVKIHGGAMDHIDNNSLKTSMRIQLLDGHINFIHRFALLLPGTRNFDEEILTTALLKELDFLTPNYFKTKVKVNNSSETEYLFVEMPTLEMTKDQNRNNGFILTGNGNNNSATKTWFNHRRSYTLTRLKNLDIKGISEKNKEVYLYGLDKLNFEYLNLLGVGNGLECCNDSELTFAKEYRRGTIRLNNFDHKLHYNNKDISSFHLIMKALNAAHGFTLEDRFFYYNPMLDIIEPIYYDGSPDIIDQKGLVYLSVSDNEKKYLNELIQKINDLDKNKFLEILSDKGLNLDKNEINKIFDQIIINLQKINNREIENYEPLFVKNYFKNHFDSKNLDFHLLFGGIGNSFEICNISLTECKKKNLTNEQFYNVLNNKFSKIDKKELLFIRISKDDYLENIRPKKRGIRDFKRLEIDDGTYLYHNSDRKNVRIDRKDKTIILNQKKEEDRFVIRGKKFEKWKVTLNGINEDDRLYYKRDKSMLGGCFSIVDTFVKDISIKSINSKCPNAIEILNSHGSIKNIEVINSPLDGFDSEFSELNIEKIFVKKTKGECVGVKRGTYKFKKLILSQCGDKAVSSGEHSFSKILDAEIYDSSYGIISKDSSSVRVEKLNLKNTWVCLHAYRGKSRYSGAEIFYNKENVSCNGHSIKFDSNSEIKSF